MPDISTTYMGIKLTNPLIVGACGLTSNLKSISRIEEMGAGAMVIKSLFEEQIQLERFKYDEDLHKYDNRHSEMITVFHETTYQGPKEHLMWVREARKAIGIPIFASLNAVEHDTWIEYARLLADAGVDGLECNLFTFPANPRKPGSEIEKEQVQLVAELKQAVTIPVSVKLSNAYTNVLDVIHALDEAGADGIVIFSRLFEPDIDVKAEKLLSPFNFSRETDSRLPLRYAALASGSVKTDICCSSGIAESEQVVKMILAGGRAVQVVSALYRHGIPHLRVMADGIRQWMSAKGYPDLAAFRGKLRQENVRELGGYTRAQYVRILMNPDALIDNVPAI